MAASQRLSTREASARPGIALCSNDRSFDRGALGAYKFGRVIGLEEQDVDRFVEGRATGPGDLEHLRPGRRDVSPR